MSTFDKSELAIHLWRMIDALSKGFGDYLKSPTRVAILFAENKNGPVYIFDPQRLLDGQKEELKEYLLTATDWSGDVRFRGGKIIDPPVLNGLLCRAFHGRCVPLQLWIAELSEQDRHAEIISNWISQAILAWELEHGDSKNLALATSTSRMLRHGARLAVETAISTIYAKQVGKDLGMRIDWIVDLLIGLSRSFEEKKHHTGQIAFQAKPQTTSVQFELPVSLIERKHIGKLLAVTDSHVSLIADDRFAYGYVFEKPKRDLLAEIKGGVCELYIDGTGIGQIDRGYFSATEFLPDSIKMNMILTGTKDLHSAVLNIVSDARKNNHGASIVVDFSRPSKLLGGNVLKPRLSHTESHAFLLGKMANIDGAIHLDADGAVNAFGCILDGHRDADREKLSRGSRFNSAVRFTRENPDSLVIVVSEDGPISFIKNGMDLLEKPKLPELDTINIDIPEFDRWCASN